MAKSKQDPEARKQELKELAEQYHSESVLDAMSALERGVRELFGTVRNMAQKVPKPDTEKARDLLESLSNDTAKSMAALSENEEPTPDADYSSGNNGPVI